LDAAILSAHAHPPYDEPQIPPPVHVSFVDWVPGICSLLGMLVVNLIDKDRVRGDEGFSDSRAVWRARLFLFIGFALMAGGLAGSVVSTYCHSHIYRLYLLPSFAITLTVPFVDHLDSQVHHACLRRAVHLLWLRERLTKRRADALRSCPMGISECWWRV
jgi:hypothetical protein